MSRSEAATLFAAAIAALLVDGRRPGPMERRPRGSAMPIGVPAGDGPHAGMVWIEGGSFTMGDDDERPEERAAHEVTSRRLLDRPPRGDQRPVRPLRRGDRLRHRGRARARPEGPSRRAARAAGAGRGRVHAARRPAQPGRHQPVVALRAGRRLAPSARARQLDRAGTIIRSSMSPTRTRWPTPNGPAASCRARRNGSSPRAAGWTARPTAGATSTTIRSRAGAPTAGRGSFRSRTVRGRLPRRGAGRLLRAQRLRPVRHGGQRLGVRARLVRARATRPRRRPIRRGRTWRWPRATPGRRARPS